MYSAHECCCSILASINIEQNRIRGYEDTDTVPDNVIAGQPMHGVTCEKNIGFYVDQRLKA